jgi:pyruvate kinase
MVTGGLLLTHRAIQELKSRGFLKGGQQVAIVQSGRQPIWRAASTHAIQVRQVEKDPDPLED